MRHQKFSSCIYETVEELEILSNHGLVASLSRLHLFDQRLYLRLAKSIESVVSDYATKDKRLVSEHIYFRSSKLLR